MSDNWMFLFSFVFNIYETAHISLTLQGRRNTEISSPNSFRPELFEMDPCHFQRVREGHDQFGCDKEKEEAAARL